MLVAFLQSTELKLLLKVEESFNPSTKSRRRFDLYLLLGPGSLFITTNVVQKLKEAIVLGQIMFH